MEISGQVLVWIALRLPRIYEAYLNHVDDSEGFGHKGRSEHPRGVLRSDKALPMRREHATKGDGRIWGWHLSSTDWRGTYAFMHEWEKICWKELEWVTQEWRRTMLRVKGEVRWINKRVLKGARGRTEVITRRHAMMYPGWFRLSPRDGTTDREICTTPGKTSGDCQPSLIHRNITTLRRQRSLGCYDDLTNLYT